MSFSGGGTEDGTFTIAAGATLGISGTFQFNPDSTITGAGDVTFQSGQSVIQGSYQIGGTTLLNSGAQADFTAAAAPSMGNLTVDGTLIIGSAQLAVSGDYTQSSFGSLDLDITAPTESGQINIGGNASLAGSISATLSSDFFVAGATVLTFADRAGDTSSITPSHLVARTTPTTWCWQTLHRRQPYCIPSPMLLPSAMTSPLLRPFPPTTPPVS